MQKMNLQRYVALRGFACWKYVFNQLDLVFCQISSITVSVLFAFLSSGFFVFESVLFSYCCLYFQMGSSGMGGYNRSEMNRSPVFSSMSHRPQGMMDNNFGYMTNDRMNYGAPMTNDLNFCCDDKDEGFGSYGNSGYDRYMPSRNDDNYGCC